jgi:predicted nucleotidyltransferase
MNFTHQAHQEMVFALLDHQVDFLLIGGYAVIYHGYIRTTGDMDIWIRPTNENKEKLLMVLAKMDFDSESIGMLARLDFTEVIVFHIGMEPERIDFLSKVQGLDFESAFAQKVTLQIDNYEIPFLRLDDLIVSKLFANRLKDQADIEYLKKIKNRKN